MISEMISKHTYMKAQVVNEIKKKIIEPVGGHVPSTGPNLGPNDRNDIRKCDVSSKSRLRILIKT